MPGHMNVLLAEANVPYDQLVEMDEINPEFERTDVALVIGANDVMNPAARTNQASPIYGMPILDVDKAQNVVVLKREHAARASPASTTRSSTTPKTQMLFGDARESVVKLVAAVKALVIPLFSAPATSRLPSRPSARWRRCARRSSPSPAASGRCRRRSTSPPTRPATSARCPRWARGTRC